MRFQVLNQQPENKNDWRWAVSKIIRNADAAETVALNYGLGNEFEVIPSEWSKTLCIMKSFGTMQEFADRCREVSKKLGSPAAVTDHNPTGIGVPDLMASWVVDGVNVQIYFINPRGCKVHPEFPGQPARPAQLHPDCAAVLRELEDA